MKHVYHKKKKEKGTKTLQPPTAAVLPQQQAQIQLSFKMFFTCSLLFVDCLHIQEEVYLLCLTFWQLFAHYLLLMVYRTQV